MVFRQMNDFNKVFSVSIIDNPSPKTLEFREHKYIQLLKTLKPLVINTIIKSFWPSFTPNIGILTLYPF